MVHGILFLLSLAMVVFLVLFDPADISWMECKFFRLTGIPCPTCGISRSFHAMVNIEITDAFNWHWLGPFLFGAIVFSGMFFGITAVWGKTAILNISTKKVITGAAGMLLLWLLVWVFRVLFG